MRGLVTDCVISGTLERGIQLADSSYNYSLRFIDSRGCHSW